MSDLNRVIITGRAARQPELKETNGKDWLFLNLAVNEYDFKTKAARTTFVSVMVGGKLAAIVADRVDKGNPVCVEAHLRVRQGDREKGTRDELSLVADNVIFMSSQPPQQGSAEPEGLI